MTRSSISRQFASTRNGFTGLWLVRQLVNMKPGLM